MSDPRPKIIARLVRLPPALDAELQLEAQRDERPIAVVIRLAIREYVRRRSPIQQEPRPSVQTQHTRIIELCEEIHPDRTAFDVCAEIVPESADRLMVFAEARTVIDTLEARKANRNGQAGN